MREESPMRVHIAVFVLSALYLACSVEYRGSTAEPATEFELDGAFGGQVTLEELRGTTVLLDFWATWCPPCVLEVPELNAFYVEHRGSGVEVVAISLDARNRQSVEKWIDEEGLQYPVAFGTPELAHTYGVDGLPYHVLIGPGGSILERLPPGYHDHQELNELLARHSS